jgi:hypothetical protein
LPGPNTTDALGYDLLSRLHDHLNRWCVIAALLLQRLVRPALHAGARPAHAPAAGDQVRVLAEVLVDRTVATYGARS